VLTIGLHHGLSVLSTNVTNGSVRNASKPRKRHEAPVAHMARKIVLNHAFLQVAFFSHISLFSKSFQHVFVNFWQWIYYSCSSLGATDQIACSASILSNNCVFEFEDQSIEAYFTSLIKRQRFRSSKSSDSKPKIFLKSVKTQIRLLRLSEILS
jgi:hypothetical protein